MVEENNALIKIDLAQFKLHVNIKDKMRLSLHFNSKSRRFYLSVIALVLYEMKKLGKITSIPLEKYYDVLALLNETVGGQAGSSDKEKLLPRVYRKWKDALPDLEHGPLFRVLGKKKEYDDAIGKTYRFTDDEKDAWANLFEYKGSQEQVRLRFSVDKLGATLDDVLIIFGDDANLSIENGWDRFVKGLKKSTEEDMEQTFTQEILTEQVGQASAQENPTVAVLPFVNLSGDPEQELFCDGITDQIITALSRTPRLFVIARHSTFTYKGKPVMVDKVGKELGVKYVLEGSALRAGDRVRITTRLVDASTGRHVWAERYDRDVTDFFALQDDIALQIVKALGVKLTEGEQISLISLGTRNLEAYLTVCESLELFRQFTPESITMCRQKAEEAVALDPKYPTAWAMVAWSHLLEVHLGFSKTPEKSIKEGSKIAQMVLDLDQSGQHGHYLMSYVYLFKGQHEKALGEIKQAVTRNPNGADVTAFYGLLFNNVGRPQEAIPLFKKAIRLNPIPPAWYWQNLGHSYLHTAQYEKAIVAYKKALEVNPNHFSAWTGITAANVLSGRNKESRNSAGEILRIQPDFSLEQWEKVLQFRDKTFRERFITALRKAGLN